MDLWFVIAAPIVVAAFLTWYLVAARRRKHTAKERGTDPADLWDALSSGEDPTDDPSTSLGDHPR